jgi:acyl-CoA thioesterase-1
MTAMAYQFANGSVLYLGVALALAGCVVGTMVGRRWLRRVLDVLGLLGVGLVLLSATPLPTWLYVVWFVAAIVILFLVNHQTRRRGKLAAVSTMVVLSLGMVLADMPYVLAPAIPAPESTTLYVVGDSLSIGADTIGGNWPDRLGQELGVKTINLSAGGKKVSGAVSAGAQIVEGNALVILEIGGNDILQRTDPDPFATDLERLLEGVCVGDRSVAMFELPLPPFYNRYGRVQRSLARSHDVVLIPKRYLSGVLSARGGTTDGLHLSSTGHALMADTVWSLCTREKEKEILTQSR